METHDLTTKMRNNEVRASNCVVGTLNFKIPGTATQANPSGDVIVSGETYEICKIPAGALVTAVYILQSKAFDSATTFTSDIGVEGSAILYADDHSSVATGTPVAKDTVTAGAAGTGVFYPAAKTVILTPTIVGATTEGELQVLVEYMEPAQRTGSYAA